jgi:hypothetical protein
VVASSAIQTDWQRGQAALRQEVCRVTTLLRSIEDPLIPALGQWNLAEVAVHLSHAWSGLPALARQDLARFQDALHNPDGVLLRSIDELGNATALAVKSDPERDLRALADRIESQAREYFSACVGEDPQAPRQWMVQGVTVSQSMLTYHLLNETLVHGYDIAHAAGRRWRIERSHAALVVSRFLIPVIRALGSQTLVAGVQASACITYELRIRGGDRFCFVFNDGVLSVEDPSPRRVDCRISADPVAFLMVTWARQSQWSAIATGKLLAWGRKPWLGPKFRGLMRNP